MRDRVGTAIGMDGTTYAKANEGAEAGRAEDLRKTPGDSPAVSKTGDVHNLVSVALGNELPGESPEKSGGRPNGETLLGGSGEVDLCGTVNASHSLGIFVPDRVGSTGPTLW